MPRLAHIADWHLMRSPRTLRLEAINRFGAGPSLGAAQHDHRPEGASRGTTSPGCLLDFPDLRKRLIEGRGHGLMHNLGHIALYDNWRITIAPE